jgi:hypothetical protein
MIKRWTQRVILGLLILVAGSYALDWAIFRLTGSPVSSVQVSRYQSVPLKGNKNEYDYLGTFDVPCSISLYPQAGNSPCWKLKRNPNQWVNL